MDGATTMKNEKVLRSSIGARSVEKGRTPLSIENHLLEGLREGAHDIMYTYALSEEKFVWKFECADTEPTPPPSDGGGATTGFLSIFFFFVLQSVWLCRHTRMD